MTTISSLTTSLPYQAPTNHAQAVQPPPQMQQVQGLAGQTSGATPDDNDTAVKAADGRDVGRAVDISA